jgi:hypothetical protein
MYLAYLLGRFNMPLVSTVDLLTAERHIKNKIAERRAAAKPVTPETMGAETLEPRESGTREFRATRGSQGAPRRPNGG